MNKTAYEPDHKQNRRLLFRKNAIASWLPALKVSWREAVTIDRSQLAIARTIRSTIGFSLPLIIGLLTGHLLEGVAVAGGAAGLGSIGLSYTYRARTKTMLLATLGVAVSALIGGLTGPIGWLSIIVAAIWGFGGGLLVAISQPALIIGLQSTVALILLSHFPLTPIQAFYQAGLMGIGALLETLLALVPFPHQRVEVERSALSGIYQALADYADDLTGAASGQPINDALVNAEAALADSNPRYKRDRAYFDLLEEGEHLRLELIVLSSIRQFLGEGDPDQQEAVQYLNRVMQAAATMLQEIAYDLARSPVSERLVEPAQLLEKAIADFCRHDVACYEGDPGQQVHVYCDALSEQLQTAMKISRELDSHERIEIDAFLSEKPRVDIRHQLGVLRANLSLRSLACRHAIRLAVILAAATAINQLFPHALQRGYWITLTALLVLKPDFTTTFTRGAARTLGTMLGAVLATLLVALLMPGNVTLIAIDIVVTFIAFSVMNVNYALFSSFITVEVVLLLTFVDPQPLTAVFVRAVDTMIGGALAILAYTLWPSWERAQVPNNVAERLDTLRRYFGGVMQAFVQPDENEISTIRHLQREAQLARSNAESSVARSLKEPAHYRIDSDLSKDLLSSTASLSRGILALEGYLLNTPKHQPIPMIATFANEIDAVMRSQIMILHDNAVAAPPPKLRETLKLLENLRHTAVDEKSQAFLDLNFVISQAGRIVDSVNTISNLLSTNYRSTSSLPAIKPLSSTM